jgi:hypothetical protein
MTIDVYSFNYRNHQSREHWRFLSNLDYLLYRDSRVYLEQDDAIDRDRAIDWLLLDTIDNVCPVLAKSFVNVDRIRADP